MRAAGRGGGAAAAAAARPAAQHSCGGRWPLLRGPARPPAGPARPPARLTRRQVAGQVVDASLYLLEQVGDVLVVKGQRAAQQRVQDDAAGPHVHLGPGVQLAADDLHGAVAGGGGEGGVERLGGGGRV
jgi:hypothetical protein